MKKDILWKGQQILASSKIFKVIYLSTGLNNLSQILLNLRPLTTIYWKKLSIRNRPFPKLKSLGCFHQRNVFFYRTKHTIFNIFPSWKKSICICIILIWIFIYNNKMIFFLSRYVNFEDNKIFIVMKFKQNGTR